MAAKAAKGKVSVGRGATTLFTFFFMIVAIGLISALVMNWPAELSATATPDTVAAVERQRFLAVAVAGAMGAMGHVVRSFFAYAGERKLVWSWVPSYFLMPVVGALFATITYILIRAGLITGGTAVGNAFGFVAIASLVGLFSGQAAEKMREVFETIFSPPEKGSDSIDDGAGPTITKIEPASGVAGDPVSVTGTHLDEVEAVVFADNVTSPATYDTAAAKLVTTVPVGAVTGQLSVTLDGATATSAEVFTVVDAG